MANLIWVMGADRQMSPPRWWFTDQETCLKQCESLNRDWFASDDTALMRHLWSCDQRDAAIEFLTVKLGRQPLLEPLSRPTAVWGSYDGWFPENRMFFPVPIGVDFEPELSVFVVLLDRTGLVQQVAGGVAFQAQAAAESALMGFAGPAERDYQKARKVAAKKWRHSRNQDRRRLDEWQLLTDAGLPTSFFRPRVQEEFEFPGFADWFTAHLPIRPGESTEPFKILGFSVAEFTFDDGTQTP